MSFKEEKKFRLLLFQNFQTVSRSLPECSMLCFFFLFLTFQNGMESLYNLPFFFSLFTFQGYGSAHRKCLDTTALDLQATMTFTESSQ